MLSTDYGQVSDNMDFILSHFEGQHELFDRTIQTFKTKGQVKIEYESDVRVSKRKMLDYFKQAGFVDCKINAFPYNTEHTGIDLEVKNITAATFIMIDLDLKGPEKKDRERLDIHLKKTLNNLSKGFHNEAHPTVLWTGNGYHVYQPIKGVVFEKVKEFYDFLPYVDKDLTTEFLRFAERFFSSGRSDPNHLPSIRSCLVRIPGSINSKNGEQVRIVQRWDGNTPPIREIYQDFMPCLIQKRIDKMGERQRANKIKSKMSSFSNADTSRTGWIERLLQTPLEDYRKQCLWRILCPYLINVRKLPSEEAAIVLNEWLRKCDSLRKTDFIHHQTIKNDLRNARLYLPHSKERIRLKHTELYDMLKSKNIFND